MGKIDLHTHSTASDGSLSPTELIIKAHEHGVNRLALTDHDTIDGITEALYAGDKSGIEVIAGIELSVNYETGDLHLLGYGFDSLHHELNTIVKKLQNSRSDRNDRIITKLNELGYPDLEESLQEFSGDGVVGRGHIAQALLKSGKFESVQDVFEQLLSIGSPAYVDRYRLTIEDAISMIHRAGGIAVWAHPGLYDDFENMLLQLPNWVDAGLDGLESDYSMHSIELRDRLRSIAISHGIIYTGGSDFHGSLKPDIMLGQGANGELVSEDCYDSLIERMESLKHD